MYVQVRYKTKNREKERKKHLIELGELFALERDQLEERREGIIKDILLYHQNARCNICRRLHKKLYWEKRVLESVLRSKYDIFI